MKNHVRLGVALLSTLALAGCGAKSDDSPAVSAATTSTTASASDATTITVTAKDFAFDPPALTAKAGDSVAFVLHNGDGTEHNLTIDGVGVDVDAKAGADGKASSVTLKPGTFAFHCEYHPQKMTGTLTVA